MDENQRNTHTILSSSENEESHEQICEQISVNLSNASDDEDDKLKETIVNSSARSCELMITDNDPVDSMPLKLGETKPTYPVDIVPGTMPWWLPHSLTERWATGILAILARFFHYTILFFIHLIVNFAVLADRLMGTQRIQIFIRDHVEYDPATIDRLLAIDPPVLLSTVVEMVETSVINEEIACAVTHDEVQVHTTLTSPLLEKTAAEPVESQNEGETRAIAECLATTMISIMDVPMLFQNDATVVPMIMNLQALESLEERIRAAEIGDDDETIRTNIHYIPPPQTTETKVVENIATEENLSTPSITDEQ